MGETIAERYRKALPGSWTEWEKACRIIPGGITHDSRHLVPFPLYVARAAGPRKWDVDGREYIDYWMGHGALFLGHSHPAMVEAVKRQVSLGTHYGACHKPRGGVGRLDHEAHPLGGEVRFTMSGTEATHLAIRLSAGLQRPAEAREVTGHFQDGPTAVATGVNPPFEIPMSAGDPRPGAGRGAAVPPERHRRPRAPRQEPQ
jgi:glutamate-1-semialdehyde 2,1-aminomutase